jgi:hypothetical protein
MSLVGLLGILFVGLKLTGYIDWSWVYVTMPFWLGLAVFLVLSVLGLLGVGVATLFSSRRSRKSRFGRGW